MADAAGIQHVMEQLRDLIPVIPERVEAVARKGAELRHAADEAVQEYKDAQGQAEELFREIESEIAGLREDALRHAAELAAEVQQVEHAVESLKALDDARGQLLHGVEQAGHAMSELRGALHDGIEEAKQVGQEFHEGLEHVHEMTRQGHDMLHKGLDTAHTAANTLQEEMKNASDGLEHLVDAYAQQLKDHEHKLLDKVEEYVGFAKDLHQQFDSNVDDILKNVVQKGADDAIDELKEVIENQLKGLVDAATQDVVDAIEELVEKVTGAHRSSQEGRGELEPLFSQLDVFSAPVKGVIDAVKSVADSVGADFS
jgi:methyl-accepting chemotaxis protein